MSRDLTIPGVVSETGLKLPDSAEIQDVLGVAHLTRELDLAADVDEALGRLGRGGDALSPHRTRPATTKRGVAPGGTGHASHVCHIPVIVAL